MNEELIIDNSNFEKYFKDIRFHKPEKGQVMAVYSAVAELVDGNLKQDMIYLLSHTPKYNETVTLFRKIGLADQDDAVRVCRELVEDLRNKMPTTEILKKPYTYKLKAFYWADKENVPKDDPHWSFVEFTNLDDHIERVEHVPGGEIRSRMILKPEKKEEDNENVDK